MQISADERAKEKVAASPTVYVANSKSNKTVFAKNIPANMLPVSAQTNAISPKQFPYPQPNPPVLVKEKGTVANTKSANILSPTAGTKYSHGNPTDGEQYVLELINRARANPKAEGERIAASKDPDLLQAIAYWKVDINKVKADFATYPQRPPYAFNEKIINAARGHSNWMVSTNTQSHTGAGGSSPWDRMGAAGYNATQGAAENIFKDADNLWYGHCGFQIDWGPGNEGLGHRNAIMNFNGTVYREIGIGITQHGGGFAITEDFGHAGINFILGVVYKDNNNNGFYDMGEGLSGVTVTPSKGSYYAVTSSSGGYAIPVQGVTGSVTVEASGGGLGAIVTKNITLSGENVKVDFTSPLPGDVSLASPLPGEVIAQKSVTFKWFQSPGGISGFGFELADNDLFVAPIVSREDLTDTTITVSDLKNGVTYYWRVRAKTPAGWGDFTEPNDFSIYIVPGKPKIVSAEVEAISADSLKCFWNKLDGDVTSYWVELSEMDNFFKTIILDSSITDTSYTFRNLEFGKTYYWHVKAKNTELWGDFSDDRTFDVMKLPMKVQQAYPEDNYTTKNTKINFGWFLKEFATLESYRFEIATDTEMKNIFMVDSTLTDTFTVLTTLTPGVQYYWRVSQSNAAGWGEYSAIRKVMITTTGVDDDILAAKFHVSATPNPTSSGVVISFEFPRTADASLTIINGIGQTVTTLTSGMLNEGKHQFAWDARYIESGVYFYRLKAENDVLTMPIVVVK